MSGKSGWSSLELLWVQCSKLSAWWSTETAGWFLFDISKFCCFVSPTQVALSFSTGKCTASQTQIELGLLLKWLKTQAKERIYCSLSVVLTNKLQNSQWSSRKCPWDWHKWSSLALTAASQRSLVDRRQGLPGPSHLCSRKNKCVFWLTESDRFWQFDRLGFWRCNFCKVRNS